MRSRYSFGDKEVGVGKEKGRDPGKKEVAVEHRPKRPFPDYRVTPLC